MPCARGEGLLVSRGLGRCGCWPQSAASSSSSTAGTHPNCHQPQLTQTTQTRADEFAADENDPEAEAEAAAAGETATGGSFPWSGTDRDYSYDELLGECGTVWLRSG